VEEWKWFKNNAKKKGYGRIENAGKSYPDHVQKVGGRGAGKIKKPHAWPISPLHPVFLGGTHEEREKRMNDVTGSGTLIVAKPMVLTHLSLNWGGGWQCKEKENTQA